LQHLLQINRRARHVWRADESMLAQQPNQLAHVLMQRRLEDHRFARDWVCEAEEGCVEGLALRRKVEENITISSLNRLARRLSFLRPGVLSERASILAENLSIRTPSLNQQVLNLSGGNQQKVVLAKWLLRNLDVVIADEPTRGVDVGAKEEIYKLLVSLKEEGKAIMVYSPEALELLAICDRIIVIHSGQIVGEISGDSPQFNEGDILEMMHAAPKTEPTARAATSAG
jgi:ABC-type sugar transport system ATPase subunit